MLAALSRAIAERDPDGPGHALRVAALAEGIAFRLGWDLPRLEAVRLAGHLHDVGKIVLAETILRKPGPLSRAELAQVRLHPVIGARLIAGVTGAKSALPAVLYHHERWDGCGYPVGRTGAAIPPAARVLAVADAFDAMSSVRPYRRPLPLERALDEVRRCAGTQFDPEVASAFLEAFEAGELEPQPARAAAL